MTKQNRDTDVAFIKALAEVLDSNNLTEITVKRRYGANDSLNVTVSKMTHATAPVAVAPAPVAAAAPVAATTTAPAAAPGDTDDPSSHPGAVASPMVGTVYLQAEPGQPAFVSVGDQVTEGQTLLIIEAMKTMNHIPAPHAGTVKRILVEDGGPVEFGAPLMIIE